MIILRNIVIGGVECCGRERGYSVNMCRPSRFPMRFGMLQHNVQSLSIQLLLKMITGISYTSFLILGLIIREQLLLVKGDNSCEKHVFSEYNIGCKCNSTYCDTVEPLDKLPPGEFVVYTSSKSGLRFSKEKGQFNSSTNEGLTFQINKEKQYQKILGFGGAFTDSACINILSLSQPAQDNLLKSYFSPDGIRYNFGRVPIGGCDFSTHKYTLDDIPGDVNLENFKLTSEDLNCKIPLIKMAQSFSDRKLNLFGTAWTAPPWMKTNNDYTGFGFLKDEYYQLWALYHLKFLQDYKKEGLDFWGITTGNEPLNGFLPLFIKFNSMGWTPKTHSTWIAENLGPLIRSSEFNSTKIIAFDDQRVTLPKWVNKIMSNTKAAQYIDGFGIHWYWDFLIPVKVVNEIIKAYPDKFVINTEASQGDKPWETKVIPGSWERGENYAEDIMEDLNNGMSGWIEWNLALDMNGGPNWAANFVDAPVLVNATGDEFYKQPMFYAIGHFAKFILPNATRIDISPLKYNDLNALAVYNGDKSIAIVLHNWSSRNVQVNINDSERGLANILLPPKSISTMMYW